MGFRVASELEADSLREAKAAYEYLTVSARLYIAPRPIAIYKIGAIHRYGAYEDVDDYKSHLEIHALRVLVRLVHSTGARLCVYLTFAPVYAFPP